MVAFDGALAVDGLAQCIHNAADNLVAHGDTGLLAGALDGGAFHKARFRTEQNAADGLLLQVQHHALGTVFKLEKFAVFGMLQTVDGSDTIADGQDPAHLLGLCSVVIILNFTFQYRNDFLRIDVAHSFTSLQNDAAF